MLDVSVQGMHCDTAVADVIIGGVLARHGHATEFLANIVGANFEVHGTVAAG